MCVCVCVCTQSTTHLLCHSLIVNLVDICSEAWCLILKSCSFWTWFYYVATNINNTSNKYKWSMLCCSMCSLFTCSVHLSLYHHQCCAPVIWRLCSITATNYYQIIIIIIYSPENKNTHTDTHIARRTY